MNIPLVLAKAQIKCLVWGYDAGIFIQKPRKINFSAELHLLVADADKIFTTKEPRAFPHSIYLKVMDPICFNMIIQVFLHPQSQFYFDIENPNRLVTLRPFPESIRLPTRAAFFDSLIEVRSDPPSGRDLRALRSLQSGWLTGPFTKGQRSRFGNDLLVSECPSHSGGSPRPA